MESNEKESVCYPQPKTNEHRVRIANDFVKRFHYKIPLVVDPIENPANRPTPAGPSASTSWTSPARSSTRASPDPSAITPRKSRPWLAKRFPEVKPPGASLKSFRRRHR